MSWSSSSTASPSIWPPQVSGLEGRLCRSEPPERGGYQYLTWIYKPGKLVGSKEAGTKEGAASARRELPRLRLSGVANWERRGCVGANPRVVSPWCAWGTGWPWGLRRHGMSCAGCLTVAGTRLRCDNGCYLRTPQGESSQLLIAGSADTSALRPGDTRPGNRARSHARHRETRWAHARMRGACFHVGGSEAGRS
jgi:hypothetical protein